MTSLNGRSVMLWLFNVWFSKDKMINYILLKFVFIMWQLHISFNPRRPFKFTDIRMFLVWWSSQIISLICIINPFSLPTMSGNVEVILFRYNYHVSQPTVCSRSTTDTIFKQEDAFSSEGFMSQWDKGNVGVSWVCSHTQALSDNWNVIFKKKHLSFMDY